MKVPTGPSFTKIMISYLAIKNCVTKNKNKYYYGKF